MKVREHILLSKDNFLKYAMEHIGESFKFYSATPNYVDIVQEVEQTEAEMHAEHLHNILEYTDVTEEEKAAIEYAIECIKTLDDMGIIKENNND